MRGTPVHGPNQKSACSLAGPSFVGVGVRLRAFVTRHPLRHLFPLYSYTRRSAARASPRSASLRYSAAPPPMRPTPHACARDCSPPFRRPSCWRASSGLRRAPPSRHLRAIATCNSHCRPIRPAGSPVHPGARCHLRTYRAQRAPLHLRRIRHDTRRGRRLRLPLAGQRRRRRRRDRAPRRRRLRAGGPSLLEAASWWRHSSAARPPRADPPGAGLLSTHSRGAPESLRPPWAAGVPPSTHANA